ncbi:MAG: DUF1015 family protein [Dehalococcoidales bacterium]|nr:DUF1015 family protein [Dehalococcoidales bacterium]
MADIRPFHGTHYNPSLAGDPARLICPPYDVISPRLQQELYDRSDHNFTRIEYGRELPQDRETDNRYTRAAATFGRWLESGILVTDTRPAIYANDHSFIVRGKEYTRRSINCLIKLEDWDKGIVKPHEGTDSRAKGDRLSLLYALQANTSPIMAMYEDTGNDIAATLGNQTKDQPILAADMGNGESHRLWAVTDKTAIRRICNILARKPVYIADGHHRYESALTYQRERRMRIDTEIGSEPFDYVMMTLIDFADPGLVILPSHRMVRGLSTASLESLKSGLNTFFDISRVPVDNTDVFGQIANLLTQNENNVTLVLSGLEEDCFQVITVKDLKLFHPMMPYFHTELYQKLDVSIVDHVLLEELLGLTHDMAGAHVAYANEASDVLKGVRDREYQLGVFVNPVTPGVIKAIADSGDRMPQKSTYFYPKIPAGLVAYRFR